VTGCSELRIDEVAGTISANGLTVHAGDEITIDGSTGRVLLGRAPMVQSELQGEVETLLAWADDYRRLGVRANVDTPADAARARELGAEGIGLCRTEHMFFGPERITRMRAMIFAANPVERRRALAALEELHVLTKQDTVMMDIAAEVD